ncbi:MAG: hypothetical protein KDB80_09555 [Planctomycetes bacterium]|nr:hypothetical protein [Planctomycetota bacterium]
MPPTRSTFCESLDIAGCGCFVVVVVCGGGIVLFGCDVWHDPSLFVPWIAVALAVHVTYSTIVRSRTRFAWEEDAAGESRRWARFHRVLAGTAVGLGVAMTVFEVEMVARFRWQVILMLTWLGLLAIVLPTLLFVATVRDLLRRPEDLWVLHGESYSYLALVAVLVVAFLTRAPITSFVWRNEDALRAACEGEAPDWMQEWELGHARDEDFRPIPNTASFGWYESYERLVIVYAPDGLDELRIDGSVPRHLFGPWYYAVGDPD